MESCCSVTRNKKLLAVVLAALLVLVAVLEVKRRILSDQLEKITVQLEQMQTGSSKQDREKATRIANKVRRLMDIGEIEPTVATIVDVDKLKERNPFYNKAENGDFLVVTSERAILYDEDRNIILDVVPVQVTPAGN